MAGSRRTRLTGTYGTESDENGSNFEDPEDATDILGMESEIGGGRGSAPRRPPMGGIDLGKGLDLEKPRPPRSPIGIEVGKSAAGNLGIGVEIPIPIPAPISGRGGVSIDPVTGQIRGGYGGLGIGKGPIRGSVDVGVDTPAGSEEFGCFKYVTFTLGPFSHTYGKNECEPKTLKTQPKPDPSSPSIPPEQSGKKWSHPSIGIDSVRGCTLKFSWREIHSAINPYAAPCEIFMSEKSTYPYRENFPLDKVELIIQRCDEKIRNIDGLWAMQTINTEVIFDCEMNWTIEEWRDQIYLDQVLSYIYFYYIPSSYTAYNWYLSPNGGGMPVVNQRQTTEPKISIFNCILKPPKDIHTPRSQENKDHLYSPPLPNPPPRKKKMDDNCCKILIQLQLETLRMMGREVTSKGLGGISGKEGFLGEKIKRIQTPITDGKKPKEIEIAFPTLYSLLAYTLRQSNDLDTALDPKSYKIPSGYIPNPKYNRDSEHSLKDNKQPDKDKTGNDRELEINDSKGIKMGGFLEQQQYMFEALKRLEYLFPFGELSDALIAKNLLIPGAKDDIKIHNMIMAYEILIQYLSAIFGNPKEALTIKDANPAIKGDQPVEVKALSLSDWLRQIVKFQIDTGGDVDAVVNLLLRDFRTNLANRTDIIKTAEMTQALFEDSGMREQQDYIPIHLEGDPYAGQWVKGQGFQANPDLEKKTEEATEKVLRETMKPTKIKVKVSRRHQDEKTDMRDLLRGLADFIQRLLSVPTGSDAAKSIEKLVENAKFKVQTEMALIRQNVAKAATATRNRTKKRKK